jgi:hypothetical protein
MLNIKLPKLKITDEAVGAFFLIIGIVLFSYGFYLWCRPLMFHFCGLCLMVFGYLLCKKVK